MADDTEIVVGSLITIACTLGAASLLLKKTKTLRVGEKVKVKVSKVKLYYSAL